jgi:hypothetical protein
MSQQFLCPLVQAIQNGVNVTQPKYTGQFGITSQASIPYGAEGTVCILSLPVANSSLSSQPDVYTFGDLTQPLNEEEVVVLELFLAPYNVPTDGLIPGNPGVVNLLYLARIFLAAQFIAGQSKSSIFAGTGLTLSSPVSKSTAISTVVSAAVSAQASPAVSQGVDSLSIGTGGSSGSSGSGGSSTPAPLFDFSNVQDTDTIGDVLNNVSVQWTAPISLGGF